MKRVKLDTAPPAVEHFLRTLPISKEPVELELGAQVILKIVPALQFSEAEKKALVKERWELIRRAQKRTKGVPARVIDREVQEAVDEVRSGK